MILTTNLIDTIVRKSLCDFTTDVCLEGWLAKEHECVNRYVHGYLFSHCAKGTPFAEYTQVGMEVAVSQPAGFKTNQRPTVRRDAVIWRKPNETCWSWNESTRQLEPKFDPAAIIE